MAPRLLNILKATLFLETGRSKFLKRWVLTRPWEDRSFTKSWLSIILYREAKDDDGDGDDDADDLNQPIFIHHEQDILLMVLFFHFTEACKTEPLHLILKSN